MLVRVLGEDGPVTAPEPLLAARDLDLLRAAVAEYTVDGVQDALGLHGQAALSRGDVLGARRACPGSDRVALLTRLFVLGCTVPETDAVRALAPLPLDRALAAGFVERSAGEVRAALDLRPYAEAAPDEADGRPSWWLVADLGTEVRPGPLRPDHVLGVGAASLTLAQSTPRSPVGSALDLGTGCGVQALHLGRHARSVTATDVSPRALRMAATSAALSGQAWHLRLGSLLEPVIGDRFDVVVANPPFVVSPGSDGTSERYDYRDGGLRGDEVSRRLVQGLPRHLSTGGMAQLLANWAITAEQDWQERVGGWLEGTPCDAWVWQREIAEPGEYVQLWLRDAGEAPGTARWEALYTAWRDWFDATGVRAIGMGLITLWATEAAPVVVLEDVPQPLGQPVADRIAEWPALQRWLARTSDADLFDSVLRHRDTLRRVRTEFPGEDGWQTGAQALREEGGMNWEIEADGAVAALVAGCTGAAPLRWVTGLLADALGLPVDGLAAAVAPVVRDLVSRGLLLPAVAR